MFIERASKGKENGKTREHIGIGAGVGVRAFFVSLALVWVCPSSQAIRVHRRRRSQPTWLHVLLLVATESWS